MSEPTTHDLVVELREALGMFAGAMPISPKQAWDEAIMETRCLRAERDQARAGLQRAIEKLADIHALLLPDDVAVDGQVFRYHDPDPQKLLRHLAATIKRVIHPPQT